MPGIKTDEQYRNEYAPKLKALTEERLTAESAKRIYNYLKPYHYDTGGWLLYEAAKGVLQSDVYSEFPAEDNMGYFETLDGYGLLKWLEVAKFADKEYEQLPGGYEKLKSHTLDINAPEYQEYQGRLYTAAVRSIIISLIEKQPYLLEGFWNRLSHIENILMRGFPTRDELNEKMEREAAKVFAAASEDDLTSFHSEVEIKFRLRDELTHIFMSDEMVQALTLKDDVLDDVYRFYLEEDRDGQTFLAAFDYLEKAEHDYLADRVFDRVASEYGDYVDEVKMLPPEKIIDAAYRLTTLYDIHISLEPETSDFSTEQLRALYSIPNPLEHLYDRWQDRDDSRMDEISDSIADTANRRADEIKAENLSSESGMENEDEDEQEP